MGNGDGDGDDPLPCFNIVLMRPFDLRVHIVQNLFNNLTACKNAMNSISSTPNSVCVYLCPKLYYKMQINPIEQALEWLFVGPFLNNQ